MVFEVQSPLAPEPRHGTASSLGHARRTLLTSRFHGYCGLREKDHCYCSNLTTRPDSGEDNATWNGEPGVRSAMQFRKELPHGPRSVGPRDGRHSSNGVHYTWILSPVVEVDRVVQ
jgi:hypothetical protein